MLAQQCPALVCLALPLLLITPKPAEASRRSPHHHRSPRAARHHRSATATVYRESDSDPHLANSGYYGSAGPWFCAVDQSRRGLLNHRISVVNTQNGRSHVFLVSDLGRFPRGNVDISRGGSARLSGRGGPDSFPVEWHDLGLAPGHKHHRRHR